MERSKSIVKIVAGERHTPFGLAEKLKVKVILESSSFQKGRERYSVLLVQEAFQLLQLERDILFKPTGADKDKVYKVKSRARDILDVCLYFANQHSAIAQDFPFPAGGVGYLSYEFSRFCDKIRFSSQEDCLALPDAAYIFGHVFVVFDHYTDLIYLIGLNYREAEIDLEDALSRIEGLILDKGMGLDSSHDPAGLDDGLGDLTIDDFSEGNPALVGGEPEALMIADESDSEEDFKRGVESVREEIIAGNLLQGVLSRRLTVYSSLRPLEGYRRLRSANPSPYLFYLDFGTYQIFGSSPEVHVKVKNQKAILRPIAGTRRRGASREEDISLEAELLEDPKERAEHLMLVDLGRNDLGRVCAPGTVKFSDYMIVERYSHVMHIVSQVEGDLSQGKSGPEALRATFPAGTVSGAPKIRAIEVLSALEKRQRKFYAGAIGYMEPGGSLDACIGIRCALKKGKKLVFQAGAGIVFDSNPSREFEETKEKMAALLRAVGIDAEAVMKTSARAKELGLDDDVVVSVGYSAAGSVKSLGAGVNQSEEPDSGQGAEAIQSRIDSIVDEKEYADGLSPSFEDKEEEEIIPLDWDFDPESATGSKEIQSGIDNLFGNGEYSPEGFDDGDIETLPEESIESKETEKDE